MRGARPSASRSVCCLDFCLTLSHTHNGSVYTYLCCQAMAEREAELCGLVEQAINEDTSAVALTRAQLRGLPDDFVVNLPVAGAITGPEAAGGGGGGQGSSAQVEQGDAERLSVGLKAPLLGPVLQMARDGAARRLALTAAQRRCAGANGARLEELVALRHARAEALGFKSHAHYMLETRCVEGGRQGGTF